jgi:hypothetical protein
MNDLTDHKEYRERIRRQLRFLMDSYLFVSFTKEQKESLRGEYRKLAELSFNQEGDVKHGYQA